ncbi:putative serine esterase (DUF676) [Geosmithia morbida]|uniref:tripeptidyl-peptidase II n=1 Tax=Geosmithia morbida TaxID=1094350 RepID=A0A9P4YNV0_9HYPO|nr:putative serine esterase (DUF676) [Geosmithia morbida]KAF4120000.1 putative serine esterase (DUF676) [Geosmithia morbida]
MVRLPCLVVLAGMAAVAGAATHPPVASDATSSRDLVDTYIGLDPEDRGQLDRVLCQVSDPNHPDYGNHLSREEAKALLQPPPEAFRSVKRWLLDEGVSPEHIEDRGQWVRARVPARVKSATSSSSRRGLPLSEASMPEHVRRYISVVRPMGTPPDGQRKAKSFSSSLAARRKVDAPMFAERAFSVEVNLTACVETLTPACIRAIYYMDEPPAETHPKGLFGVPGFLEQTVQFDDFDEFNHLYAPYVKSNITVELVNGGVNPQGNYASGEANMDIQYAVAMAYDVPVQFISVGGGLWDFNPDLDIPEATDTDYVEPYLEFAEYLLDLPDEKLPQVISISYGMNEQVMPRENALKTCEMFGQLGTRGVSILVASGDVGPGAGCQSNDGTNTTIFIAQFPASCPYVTAVGATEGNSPETAVYFTGGGFSNLWARPAWQDDVVKSYLDVHGQEWSAYYNSSGRAYPDVAAFGLGHKTVNHGEVEDGGGTSASTPVVAAIVARLNNERFLRGQPALGFLNPWIYGKGKAGFTDIVAGSSVGCEGTSRANLPAPAIPGAGFAAVEGWDPATGVGTPRYDQLKEIALEGHPKAQHLCVLVHGLWGNPDHLNNIAKNLRAKYGRDELYLLLAKRNTGSFTYDGIERGGERVCAELEEEIRLIEAQGGKITKLSIIGYSLGGLVSRYAVGLLHAKGFLDKVECMNFTTFATPHLGVRTPLKGWHNHIWNVMGARTLAMSGRQLFMIDKFRDTERPLLAILADPKSIFMSGLRRFRRHTLYTNIVNDRSAVYYTTAIEKTDIYKNPETLKLRYVPGCEPVIIDMASPVVPLPESKTAATTWESGLYAIKMLPFALKLIFFMPVGVVAFLINSVIQTVRSSNRVRLHEGGKAGINVDEYRFPLLIKGLRDEVQQAFEALNNSQDNEYLAIDDDEVDDDAADAQATAEEQLSRMRKERRMSIPTQPTLALTAAQFHAIDSLNTLGWRKYPVWIHRNAHSHAALIVRMDRETFAEGWIVLNHFVESEFLV